MEYTDEETFEEISDQCKILTHYIYSFDFVLEFIALFPFEIFIKD